MYPSPSVVDMTRDASPNKHSRSIEVRGMVTDTCRRGSSHQSTQVHIVASQQNRWVRVRPSGYVTRDASHHNPRKSWRHDGLSLTYVDASRVIRNPRSSISGLTQIDESETVRQGT